MKEKNHIIKSNNLIDCSYKLTLSEQRLINLACKKLKPKFIDKNISMDEMITLVKANVFEPIEITVPEYKKEFKVRSNNIYNEMTSVADSLFERKIVYYDDRGVLTKKRWVITSRFDDSSKKVSLQFHPDLIMDLLVFRGKYTKLNYSFLTSIKNSYTGRIYELLRQYLALKKRVFDLNDLRFKLNLLDGEYPNYANLKQKILTPSVKWINENSDINIDFTEIKKGRKVVGIHFSINPSEDNSPKSVMQQLSMEDMQIDYNSVYTKIKNIIGMDITGQEVDSICQSAIDGIANNKITDVKSMDYISTQWNNVLKYSKNNKVENKIGCLIKALRDNWETPKSVINKNNKTLKFNNFEARDIYNDKEAMNDLERALLGWNDEVAITKED